MCLKLTKLPDIEQRDTSGVQCNRNAWLRPGQATASSIAVRGQVAENLSCRARAESVGKCCELEQ